MSRIGLNTSSNLRNKIRNHNPKAVTFHAIGFIVNEDVPWQTFTEMSCSCPNCRKATADSLMAAALFILAESGIKTLPSVDLMRQQAILLDAEPSRNN